MENLYPVNQHPPISETYRQSLFRIDFNHALEQALAVGWHKVWNVKHSSFHLFEQLPEVIVVEG